VPSDATVFTGHECAVLVSGSGTGRRRTIGLRRRDPAIVEGRMVDPMPRLTGHEVADSIVTVGSGVGCGRVGQRVVLSRTLNHGPCFGCGRFFYCGDGPPTCRRGELPLGELVVYCNGLDEIDRRPEDLRAGQAIWPIIVSGDAA
jgi:Zn-dependent alcohol dehydrogenase